MELDRKRQLAKLNASINQSIVNFMKIHDKDSSGFLDRQEARRFISDILLHLGIKESLSDEDFDVMYRNFDLNQDGVIQRAEVKAIIYTLTGLGKGNKDDAQNELAQLIQDSKKMDQKKEQEKNKKEEEEWLAKLYEEVKEPPPQIIDLHISNEEIMNQQILKSEEDEQQQAVDVKKSEIVQSQSPVKSPTRKSIMISRQKSSKANENQDHDKATKDNDFFQKVIKRVEEIEQKEQEIKKLEGQLELILENQNDQQLLHSKLQTEKGFSSNIKSSNSLMQNTEQQKISKTKAQIAELLKRVERERSCLMIELKKHFSYIRGANLEGEDIWKYEQSLYKKILRPARTVTSCQIVLKELLNQNNDFGNYMKKFRRQSTGASQDVSLVNTSFDNSKILSRYKEALNKISPSNLKPRNIDEKNSPTNQQTNKSTINLQSHHPIIPSFKFINANSSTPNKRTLFFNSRLSSQSNKQLEVITAPNFLKSQHEIMQTLDNIENGQQVKQYILNMNRRGSQNHNQSVNDYSQQEIINIDARNMRNRKSSFKTNSKKGSPENGLTKIQSIYFDSVKDSVLKKNIIRPASQQEVLSMLTKQSQTSNMNNQKNRHDTQNDDLLPPQLQHPSRLTSFNSSKLPQNPFMKAIMTPNNKNKHGGGSFLQNQFTMMLNEQPFNYKSFYTKSSCAVIEEPHAIQKNSRTIARAKVMSVQEKTRGALPKGQQLMLSGQISKMLPHEQASRATVIRRQGGGSQGQSSLNMKRRELLKIMREHQASKCGIN